MRHAILGAGGVGGLVGAALARAGADVVLLLRPETLARHPARLHVESAALGVFDVDLATASGLDREVDALWLTVKAPSLEAALALAPAERVDEAVVVPLLNGVDHDAVLRARYARVLAGAFRGETERVEPGVVVQKWQLARVDLAPGPRRDEIADEVRATGLAVAYAADDATLLWAKLAFLAPLALTTTARGAPVGTVQDEREWKERLMGCHDEAVAVGLAEGASLDATALRRAMDFSGGELRTSMQKDFDAGRPLELDAIGGPIVRGGLAHGIATATTDELLRLVEARLSERETRVTV